MFFAAAELREATCTCTKSTRRVLRNRNKLVTGRCSELHTSRACTYVGTYVRAYGRGGGGAIRLKLVLFCVTVMGPKIQLRRRTDEPRPNVISTIYHTLLYLLKNKKVCAFFLFLFSDYTLGSILDGPVGLIGAENSANELWLFKRL